jgi:hypothetical protein
MPIKRNAMRKKVQLHGEKKSKVASKKNCNKEIHVSFNEGFK